MRLLGRVLLLVLMVLFFTSGYLYSQEVKCIQDNKCSTTIECTKYKKKKAIVEIEKQLIDDLKNQIDWIFAILSKIDENRKVRFEINPTNDKSTLNLSIVTEESKYFKVKDPTIAISLDKAIKYISERTKDIPEEIETTYVCMDLRPITNELNVPGSGTLKYRFPVALLYDLNLPKINKYRRGYITIEDSEGYVILQNKYDIPDVVSVNLNPLANISKAECSLNVSVRQINPAGTNETISFKNINFDTMPQKFYIRWRIAEPETPIKRTVTIIEKNGK
jgi:hypothetical protein